MKWVYILRCEDDYYYVGETSRLYRRFWEHHEGRGGLNTSIYNPEEIVAIYKVDTICKFIDYNEYVNKIIDGIWHDNYKNYKLTNFNDDNQNYDDNLFAENNITECLMLKTTDWNKIRGGKYVRFEIEYKYPENDYIKDLPLCNCGLPCDIKKNEDDNYLYFRCAKKNMWDKLKKEFDIIAEPCSFFTEYTKDKQFKNTENTRLQERRQTISMLMKKSSWLENVEVSHDNSECVGGCGKINLNAKLTYKNEKRNLCFDCLINKNEEISKKYKIDGKCLIKMKK
jgi:predicted GIY-YIG superfamily endonuclease